MLPAIELFSLQIPSYWVCALLGAVAASILLLIRHRHFKELRQVDITNSAALGAIGMIIGARLLYLLTILPSIVQNWSIIAADPHIILDLISNGMVYYGGLFGALVALLLYYRKYKLDSGIFFDYFTPAIPLFHAFGRIGCFLTGCCHGVVSEQFGIAYVNSISSANGVPYFPIQLVGALLELCACIAVTLYERKHHNEGTAIKFYLLIYAIGRFIIEFFRGDTIRGIWFGLSTSQWISIFVLIALAIDIARKKKPVTQQQPGSAKRNLL
ncbi:MAG: prolipoprotein diacylglyceryl transferase [bacterium]|nr:prolipoprotein diacylglyceryl transferase [bacterium]